MPEVADVNVSLTANVPVTFLIFNKPLSVSILTIVPEPPDELVIVLSSKNVPVIDVTIALLKNPKVGGVGEAS